MSAYKSPKGAINKLINHVKAKGKDRSWAALTKKFFPGGSDDWARNILRSVGFDTKTNTFTINEKIEHTKSRSENRRHRSETGKMANEIIRLRQDIEFLL